MTDGVPQVRAAGGVVWRGSAPDALEVLVVHRNRYDDWSLPKGKRDGEESDEACALREVEEETGLRCVLGDELVGSAYIDRKGRTKEVRWWAMAPVDGAFTPGEEVDELRWLHLEDARRLLSYERDVEVLDDFARRQAD